MKKLLVSGVCLAGLVFMTSCNSETNNETDSLKDTSTTVETVDTSAAMRTTVNTEDDSVFAKKAAEGGLMEVQLGQLALKNATSSAVKKHAQMMVTDHGKANAELKTLAASKNIMLPKALGDEKQKMVNDLKAKKGADFDKAYSDMMVEDHKKDIDLFRTEAEGGRDAEIKAWAAGKLPTLQSHLQMWESAKMAVDSIGKK
ncbi:MAG: DUF4142 domain-containing protein [Bacteroidota bacterium]|nr:DUF4142 domain-containing protein [Ferruginibacter sp.]